MFKYFFYSKDNIPTNVGFQMYDKSHILWLCLITCFIVIISNRYKNLTEKKREHFKKIYGIIVLMTEIIYQTIHIVTHQFTIDYLPLHLCGLAIYICLYDVFFPSDLMKEFFYCLCMPGALMALLFPNWTCLPIFNFACIDSFILHAMLVAYPIMLIRSGEFSPDFRRLPKCNLILLVVAIPIYGFNKIFNTNFLFINFPSEGSPMVVLEKWLGNPGYIIGVYCLVLICWFILYIPFIIKNICIEKYKVKNIYT